MAMRYLATLLFLIFVSTAAAAYGPSPGAYAACPADVLAADDDQGSGGGDGGKPEGDEEEEEPDCE